MLNTIYVKTQDINTNFAKFAQEITQGSQVLVSRPKNENIALISEKRLNELLIAENNQKMNEKILASRTQIKNGEFEIMSFEELELQSCA